MSATRNDWLFVLRDMIDAGAPTRIIRLTARKARAAGARTGDIAKAAKVTKIKAWGWCQGIRERYER